MNTLVNRVLLFLDTTCPKEFGRVTNSLKPVEVYIFVYTVLQFCVFYFLVVAGRWYLLFSASKNDFISSFNLMKIIWPTITQNYSLHWECVYLCLFWGKTFHPGQKFFEDFENKFISRFIWTLQWCGVYCNVFTIIIFLTL